MANRAWHWNQPTIRIGLTVACFVVLAVVVVFWAERVPARVKTTVLLLAGATALTWMLAGEITSSRGSAYQSKIYARNLPQPLDWIDRATGDGGTTFIGQNISTGEALGVNLLEFWNRSVKHIWSLDGTAPPPGPTLTPDLLQNGKLSHDPGLPFVVATDRVDMVGPIVAVRRGLTLRRIPQHPWRLHQSSYHVSDDGWITGTNADPLVANGTFAYFGPERAPGMLNIVVGRVGFCSHTAPSAHVTLRVGPLVLDEQRAPTVVHATWVKRFVLPNCVSRRFHLTVTPPIAVTVQATPTIRLTDYGGSDDRDLGAQVGFSFTPKR
jgi:hypothetical protein